MILAHPDDPEFFCGASIARWAARGHHVSYCLFTRGDKGVDGKIVNANELMFTREAEQKHAARVLGVKAVRFLDYLDGYLIPSLEARKTIVRVIRQEKPDVVVTSDPTNFFPMENRINHPDHRIAGQIVMEAVFPACGNPMFFPELIYEENLLPHQIKELWFSLTVQPSVALDVTEFWELKIKAIQDHKSQIANPAALEERLRGRRTPESSPEAPRFEEKFRRIIF